MQLTLRGSFGSRGSPLTLLLLAACAGEPDPQVPATPKAEAAPAAAPASRAPDATPEDEPVRVELLAPGDGAKHALRYAFHPGRREAMAMDMDMTLAMTIGEKHAPPMKLPRVHMVMGIDPKSVLPNGDLVYRFDVSAADVADDPDSKPGTVAAMRDQIRKLAGLYGEVEVTPRGGTVRATMEAPPSLDQNMRDVLDQVKSSLRDLSAPLPEEPVGVGASWRSVAPFKMRGIHATRTVTYHLKAIDGDRASLDEGFEITAAVQPIENKDLPAGTKLTLLSLKAGGSGTMALDLQSLVPTSRGSIDSMLDTSIEGNGQKQPLSVATKLDLTVAPTPP